MHFSGDGGLELGSGVEWRSFWWIFGGADSGGEVRWLAEKTLGFCCSMWVVMDPYKDCLDQISLNGLFYLFVSCGWFEALRCG